MIVTDLFECSVVHVDIYIELAQQDVQTLISIFDSILAIVGCFVWHICASVEIQISLLLL